MTKKKYKLKNKKLYIIISIIVVFIISFIVYLIYSRNKFINDIKSHYGKKIEIIKNTKIYSKNKKVIGTVNKGYTFDIENKTIDDTDDTYFKIKNTDYYLYYDSVRKVKKIVEDKLNDKYIVFNKTIEAKDITFYINDKKAFSINKKLSLPIEYMDDKYYYVYYLNRLLQVKRNTKVIEKENTKDNEISYISVINYNEIYDKNSKPCNEDDCIDISFIKDNLKYLKEKKYYTITTNEYNEWIKGNIRLKPNAILLTTSTNDYIKDLDKEFDLSIQNIQDTKLKFNDNNTKNTKQTTNSINRYNVKKKTTMDDFKRMVAGESVIEKKETSINQSKGGVAVLNYHFFYDGAAGENCNENICLDTSSFRKQLDYLKNNGYKTLTMDEFVKWMYNEITLPEKSVLITVDDGAMGTSKINGNKLIPILEEYKMNATLFLITAWWDKSNYESKYLDVESHGDDIHITGDCGKNKIHCLNKEQLLDDFNKSKQKLGTNLAFCYPFYSYNNTAIEAIKETGFRVAFIGGNRKAKQSDNKYLIPRYPIYKTTSIESFIQMVS